MKSWFVIAERHRVAVICLNVHFLVPVRQIVTIVPTFNTIAMKMKKIHDLLFRLKWNVCVERRLCQMFLVQCTVPCGKDLPNCHQKCIIICHSHSPETSFECQFQQQNCQMMPFGHSCQSKCHSGTDCPSVLCNVKIYAVCSCGHRKVPVECKFLVSGNEKIECDAECARHLRNQIGFGFGC